MINMRGRACSQVLKKAEKIPNRRPCATEHVLQLGSKPAKMEILRCHKFLTGLNFGLFFFTKTLRYTITITSSNLKSLWSAIAELLRSLRREIKGDWLTHWFTDAIVLLVLKYLGSWFFENLCKAESRARENYKSDNLLISKTVIYECLQFV